jgi:hypothetical protein
LVRGDCISIYLRPLLPLSLHAWCHRRIGIEEDEQSRAVQADAAEHCRCCFCVQSMLKRSAGSVDSASIKSLRGASRAPRIRCRFRDDEDGPGAYCIYYSLLVIVASVHVVCLALHCIAVATAALPWRRRSHGPIGLKSIDRASHRSLPTMLSIMHAAGLLADPCPCPFLIDYAMHASVGVCMQTRPLNSVRWMTAFKSCTYIFKKNLSFVGGIDYEGCV